MLGRNGSRKGIVDANERTNRVTILNIVAKYRARMNYLECLLICGDGFRAKRAFIGCIESSEVLVNSALAAVPPSQSKFYRNRLCAPATRFLNIFDYYRQNWL